MWSSWWRSAGGCHRKPARQGIQYALSRWEALTRYAGDGRIGLSNNAAEQALRELR
jgi:transposase